MYVLFQLDLMRRYLGEKCWNQYMQNLKLD